MSNAQRNFIDSLREQLGLDTLTDADYYNADGTPKLSKAQASDVIGQLLAKKDAMPKDAPKPKSNAPEVPAGRYALKSDQDGEVYFFKVEKGKDGTRWEGYTFLKRQSSDDLWPIKNAEKRNRILGQIAADVPAAMALYGKEIGRCGHCHKTLTSEWRERGIGPVCARKMGWGE